MEKRKTIHYFQWIRAVGAVSIVILHAIVTLRVAVGADTLPEARIMAEELLILAGSRWVVPAFFMVSGALMLDPKRSMGWDKTLRHVWRLGFVLLTFGFGFCVVEAVVKAGTFDGAALLDAVGHFVSGRSWDHLWFVYTLLGYYLVTPIIRPWVAQASQRELGLVTFWTTVLVLGAKGLSAELNYTIYNFAGVPYTFPYYLMGYYVHTYLRLDRKWVAFGLASLLAMMGFMLLLGWEWVGDPHRGLVTPYAIMVVLLFKRYLDVPTKPHRLVDLLADFSFGIYLVHPIFQHLMVELLDLTTCPAVLAYCALTVVPLLLSLVMVWLLRKVPGFADKI